MIFNSPPQFGQCSRPSSKTKLQRRLTCTQVMSELKPMSNHPVVLVTGAAQRIGRGSPAYAMTAGGQELGMHEPRFHPALATQYSADPTPGRHTGAGSSYEALFLWDKVSFAPAAVRQPRQRPLLPSLRQRPPLPPLRLPPPLSLLPKNRL